MRALPSAFALSLIACGGLPPPAPELPSTPRDTTPERPVPNATPAETDTSALTLAERIALRPMLTRIETQSRVQIAVERSSPAWRGEVALPLLEASVRLSSAGGIPVIDSLSLALSDIEISAADQPPAGLHLTAIRVEADTFSPITANWSDDSTRVDVDGRLDLAIHMSLVSESGRVLPMRPIDLHDIAVKARIERRAGGEIGFGLTGGANGRLWSVDDLFALSNVGLAVDVAEPRD